MCPTVLSYLVNSVPIFQSNCCAQRQKGNNRKEDMINVGRGSFGNISVGNVNIKRPLLFESCCKKKKRKQFSAVERWGTHSERDKEYSFPERQCIKQ